MSFRPNRFNRNFHRPYNNGHQARRQSQLQGVDINTFIKKSAESSTLEYTPNLSFNDFAIKDVLKTNIAAKGYTTPTEIQDKAIQPILEGRDLIGLAQTGTGKTAAFLIPIINNIFTDRSKKALIVTPTRELAIQINEELKRLSFNMRIYSSIIIGGSSMTAQIQNLGRNPQVVIGTPGRLKDLVVHKKLHLEDFSIFVLDEVDLMVDIGFINDVKYFLSFLPIIRQSLFFSATISPKIQSILLQGFVKDPITVSVKKQTPSETVNQDVVRVQNPAKKVEYLHDLLIKDGFNKVLIFGRTKFGIEKLNKELTFRGFKTGALHGNKRQSQRRRVLESFKNNEIQILLATDVASRGLDIDNVTHVINYDLPQTYEDYIHRIGRTGRAGKIGTALTFIENYS